ncbi:MAG: DUF4428 domain-containing protein [Oscillospiraceae bacterium]
MGLFDKKYCDVCGEKIGLLGNRKLEDGNLCKDCAAKLSPFFSGRKNATVDEIKAQLAYREENKQKLSSFNPTKTFGEHKRVYIDEANGSFIVTASANWRSVNPDIISLSQVTACNTDIKENRDEIYRETQDGNRESYVPPRYEYSYEFNVEILVNSPWFSSIELELSDGDRPDSRYTEQYREYERQMYELSNALMSKSAEPQTNYAAPSAAGSTAGFSASTASGSWTCSCGAENTGKFCEYCGAGRPESGHTFQCDKCGWKPEHGQQPPKFCPECGDPFDGYDVR